MDPLAQLLGESPGIVAVREQVRRLLQRQSDTRRMPSVLIQGETGTGKGLLARAMHDESPRTGGPFVDVNCAAIPETLLEAEMFGVERGAFTDARQAKPGLFQLAHRGTIFLDEIGLLPEALQAKLLKVIEERAVRRLGSTRSEVVDVWVIAATNEDLREATQTRRFRADLYHRLAVLTVALPPLRERGDDAVRLAEYFLTRACSDYGLSLKVLGASARAALLAYPWPGNVRELANLMERVALLTEERHVTADMLDLPKALPPVAREVAPGPVPAPLAAAVGDVERRHLLSALEETGWNITQAATRLGVSRNTLRYRIEKHGLSREERAARRRPEPVSHPVETAPAVPTVTPAPIRERRRLTLLRVALVDQPQREGTGHVRRTLDLLHDKVRTFGGRVEELNLGGIIAIFGLEPVEDAPLRAAHAALAIRVSVERMRLAEGSGMAPVRMAIHVDQFLVAPNGGTLAIDLEARLHAWEFLDAVIGAAGPYDILVSEAASPFLERRFDLAAAGMPERLPGPLYRLTRREGAGLAPGGRMARFVGRQYELEFLRDRFELAAGGRGQVIGIAGEAGIGKSRLLFEFRERLAGRPAISIEGHCLSYGSSIPYLPVLEIVRAMCGIAEADTPEAVRDKVSTSLRDIGLDPAETAAYLLHLLGVKDDGDRLSALNPNEIKARVFEILRQLMLMRSRHRPLVLVVEDLHWVDRSSEEYLAALADVVSGAAILLISTYRPGYHPPWIERSYATQMALQPLGSVESRNVVRSVLGAGDAPDAVVDLILGKAEGNPFFLEELTRAVREQGASAASLTVPDTVQEVLLARIGRLPADQKELLQAAAVVGKDVPVAVLQAIAQAPDAELRHRLARLKVAEFLYEKGLAPEPEYTFKHAVTYEVVYESMPAEQRQALHAEIVAAIERLYPDRLAEHIEQLAHHALRGGLWADAVRYLRRAGHKALSASANLEAVACLQAALEALSHLPDSRERAEQAIDLRFDLRAALHPLGEFARILSVLEEAQRLAEALGDQHRLGQASAHLTQYFWWAGDPDQAVRSGQRALNIAAEVGDVALEITANFYLGVVYHALGDYRPAMDFVRRNVISLKADRLRERFGMASLASVNSRTWLVYCLAELGDFAEAITVAEEAVRIAETADHPFSLVQASFGLGFLHLRQGEFDRAVPLLEHGLALCRRWNIPIWFPRIASALGTAYAGSGRVAEALPLLEQAVEAAASKRILFGRTLAVAWLSEAYCSAGRLGDATALAEHALTLAREHNERGNQAHVLRLLGEITSRRDPLDVEEGERRYWEAIELAEALGMRPLLAHCHLGLGTLYRRAGRGVDVTAHLQTAAALYSELGTRRWREEAARALRASA